MNLTALFFTITFCGIFISTRAEIQKRFGCWRYECPPGQICMENHVGTAYCMPSKTRELDMAVSNILKKEYGIESPQKRHGCDRHECGEDKMCKLNRWGDAYCMEVAAPGPHRSQAGPQLRSEQVKNLLKELLSKHK